MDNPINVFEMLVDRLSNVEETMSLILASLRHAADVSCDSAPVSGMAMCGVPARVTKMYKNEDLLDPENVLVIRYNITPCHHYNMGMKFVNETDTPTSSLWTKVLGEEAYRNRSLMIRSMNDYYDDCDEGVLFRFVLLEKLWKFYCGDHFVFAGSCWVDSDEYVFINARMFADKELSDIVAFVAEPLKTLGLSSSLRTMTVGIVPKKHAKFYAALTVSNDHEHFRDEVDLRVLSDEIGDIIANPDHIFHKYHEYNY